ncbi:MAG TPA: NAD-dependent protein deacylase, partial [Kiritimatiellia bacterium]|nr:NAD-dependent protein deacylase [Kiritimatiellia bacterium]
ALAQKADLMLVLGSSLTVHPAASVPPLTVRAGGELVIVNAQPTPLDRVATLCYPDLAAFAEAALEAWPEK